MQPSSCIEMLYENNYQFITGVPDSIFKDLLNTINDDNRFEHILTSNEGESCALAAGYHLATGKIPVVYMQNSGLGNAINPLTSLLDSEIYAIPSLLMISWRGLPGEHDEPQHKRMGNILPGMCALLDIPYAVASKDPDQMSKIFKQANDSIKKHNKPFAILFPKNTFETNKGAKKSIPKDAIIRENLLEELVKNAKEDDIFVTTTGKTSRELYEIRDRLNQDHSRDFLTVGSMGCASTLALGIAMKAKNHRVILVDGDGACLMRLESLATIGHLKPENLLHIVIDNNAYESTGSQPTLSTNVDFAKVAMACGYESAHEFDDADLFKESFLNFKQGPQMLVMKSFPYSRSDLGRPKTTPIQNKVAFMKHLSKTKTPAVV